MWVKVCGLRTVENALQVAEAGVDAIGLNFYSPSKRSVSLDVSKEIVAALPSHVMAVGLFVNHSIEEIKKIVAETGLETIQLHGDETPEFAAHFKHLNIIKAFRIDAENVKQLGQEIAAYQSAEVDLFGCLIDAKVGTAYGGTGQVAPWNDLRRHYDIEQLPSLILAGGLTPANVQEAVEIVSPWGVDTASGVETSPGVKDLKLTTDFIRQAKSTLHLPEHINDIRTNDASEY